MKLVHLRSHETRACVLNVCSETVSDRVERRTDFFEHANGIEFEEGTGQVEGMDERYDTDGRCQLEAEKQKEIRVEERCSIFQKLREQTRVAHDIHLFYYCLTHFSEIIVTTPVNIMEQIIEYPTSIRCFLDNCESSGFSRGQIKAVYNMLIIFESDLPEEHRVLSNHIRTVAQLEGLLNAMRDEKMYTERWKRSIIDLNELNQGLGLRLPLNRTGTFRCPLELLREQLQEHGLCAVKKFEKSTDESGRRTYSCPINGTALELYSAAMATGTIIVCVDLYCDGVALSRSGTQSISPLRVRFCTMKGIEIKWFDIGLCPTVDLRGTKTNSTTKAEIIRDLLQRYLFLVLRPMVEASIVGFTFQNCVVYPRLLMTVCDQKEERPLMSLKSNGSTRDCTLCTMLTKVTAAEVAVRNGTPVEKKEKGRGRTSTVHRQNVRKSADMILVQPSSRESSMHNVQHKTRPSSPATSACSSGSSPANSACSSGSRKTPIVKEIMDIQLNSEHASKREVVVSIGAQLLLAITKVIEAGDVNRDLLERLKAKLPSFWFNVNSIDTEEIRRYAVVHSCCEMPPVLSNFQGLVTEPFLLYESISFDILHVWDLGLMRIFTESCWMNFTKKKYTSLPITQCMHLANTRLQLLPRGAHLPRTTIFLGSETEKISGMTGLIRRLTTPFMWVCLIGLNDKIDPDCDQLVQVALELDYIHSQLLGTNKDYDDMHRSGEWIIDLQKRCFVLGKLAVQLFGCNVTTKIHRVMRHLDSHLKSFGLIRWGASDTNERKHKSVKKAYRRTNRQQDTLGVQLLRRGYADDVDSDTNEPFGTQSIPDDFSKSNRYLVCVITSTAIELDNDSPLATKMERLISMQSRKRRTRVWTLVTYLKLQNHIPWKVDSSRQHVMGTFTYRPWCTSGPHVRMDGCVYNVDGEFYHGLVQAIIRNA